MPEPSPVLPDGREAAVTQFAARWSAPTTTPKPTGEILRAEKPPLLPHLSSGFGYRIDPIRGIRALHAGIDIPGALGSNVSAAAYGIIRFAGPAGSYGNMIEIDHGNGLTTRYAHLYRVLVAIGSPVTQGQAIALMGSTGRSTGSHLHFEVRVHGQATEPLAYFGNTPQWLPSQPIAAEKPYVSAFAQARAAAKSASGTDF